LKAESVREGLWILVFLDTCWVQFLISVETEKRKDNLREVSKAFCRSQEMERKFLRFSVAMPMPCALACVKLLLGSRGDEGMMRE